MAFMSETHHAASSFSPAWFSAMVEAHKIRRIRRKAYLSTFNELNAMSEKELADIGLSSLMIHDIAREAADLAA